MKLVILGASISSAARGSDRAAAFRALVRELGRSGHEVLYLERSPPSRAPREVLAPSQHGSIRRYRDLADLKARFAQAVRGADAVIVCSRLPQGAALGDWVLETAAGISVFYDLDPTMAAAARTDLTPSAIRRYRLYLSVAGGPLLRQLERELGSPCARTLYRFCDPEQFYPERRQEESWDLGYLGGHCPERRPRLEALLLEPARRWRSGRFVIAGAGHPVVGSPSNVSHRKRVPYQARRGFYGSLRYTLCLAQAAALGAGYAPSVRLFEAAASGAPMIADDWPGLDALFSPGEEVLLVQRPEEVLVFLTEVPDTARRAMGELARRRVLTQHTAAHRAVELVEHLESVVAGQALPLQGLG